MYFIGSCVYHAPSRMGIVLMHKNQQSPALRELEQMCKSFQEVELKGKERMITFENERNHLIIQIASKGKLISFCLFFNNSTTVEFYFTVLNHFHYFIQLLCFPNIH